MTMTRILTADGLTDEWGRWEGAADSLEVAALHCTDSARLLSADGLEAAAPGVTSAEALLPQGGGFTVTWLPAGRALPLGASSALTPDTAGVIGVDTQVKSTAAFQERYIGNYIQIMFHENTHGNCFCSQSHRKVNVRSTLGHHHVASWYVDTTSPVCKI